MEELKADTSAPESSNRLDEIIVFRQLQRDEVKENAKINAAVRCLAAFLE